MSRGWLDRGWGIASGLVGAACTLANPAYEGGDGQTEGSASTGGIADGTATTGRPGDGTLDGGTLDGGSEGPEVCAEDGDCADDVYCNGAEVCDPGGPETDDRGCRPALGDPCLAGTHCDEEQDRCVTDCELGNDADRDGVPSVDCQGDDCNDSDPEIFPGAAEVCDEVDDDCDPTTIGELDADLDDQVSNECCNFDGAAFKCGPDCDDSLAGITLAGSDWAHCTECGASCDPLQACQAGMCIPARRVFATSTTQSGNLGGLEGADSRCQELAELADLQGAWRAFIVDGETGLEQRLEPAAVPYVRLDGVWIASDWADLTNDSLLAPLSITEERVEVEGFGVGSLAWTGISDVAVLPNGFCSGWTYEGGMCGLQACGTAGDVTATNTVWDSTEASLECSLLARLYCIEQGGG